MQPKSDEGVPQITIRQIAERCGIDPSSVRKDLRKMGVVPDRVPHSHFGAMTMLAITPEEFERFLEDRRARGLSTDCDGGTRDWKWFSISTRSCATSRATPPCAAPVLIRLDNGRADPETVREAFEDAPSGRRPRR